MKNNSFVSFVSYLSLARTYTKAKASFNLLFCGGKYVFELADRYKWREKKRAGKRHARIEGDGESEAERQR